MPHHCNSSEIAEFDSGKAGVLSANGVSTMMRKIVIGLAAAAIAMGGSTFGASATKGGGGGGPHGGGGPVMGGGPHGGGGGPGYRMGGSRAYAFHGRGYEHRYDYRRPYRYDYRRPYRYGYYKTYPSYGGSCWRWTPEGRVWVCGYERPYYGYRYSYDRPYYRYGHYRPYGGYGGHHGPSYG